jgi:dephospho-CoA kinase
MGRLVLGLTGMPGSGKSIVAEFLKQKGFRIFEMGDVIRSMMKKKGIEITNHSLREFSLNLRRRYGNDIVAKESVKQLKKMKGNVVISGVRSINEMRYFKKSIPELILIALVAPKQTRFQRLKKRKRSDDPQTLKEFDYREEKETVYGIPRAVKMADLIVSNAGSIKELNASIGFALTKLAKN